jgi:hypothetical protein
MKHPLSIALPALLLASTPLMPVSPPSVEERAALLAASPPALGALRAGSSDSLPPLGAAERAALARAQVAAPALGEQRAGELVLSDRDLMIIGIVLVAVLIIAAVA